MIQIKNRFTGLVILEGDFKTVAELISANSGSNLSYTDLSGSNLSYSNLKGSNFSYTKSGDLIISAIYSIGPIGSRSDYLQCWAFDNGDRQYKTGCFSGTESEFIAAVSAHGIEKHKTDYMAAIAFFNAILEVQNNG